MDFHKLQESWKKLKDAMAGSGVNNIPTKDLIDLSNQMKTGIDILSIFPETETARYWLCIKRGEIENILCHRSWGKMKF